jgi:predicted phage terminase large subunit-like protein
MDRLDPVTRRQLRWGDWTVRPEGNLFKRAWLEANVVDEEAVPRLARTVRAWDLAATEEGEGGNDDPDFTASVLMGVSLTGTFYVMDAREFRATPADTEDAVKAAANADGQSVEVFMEQEPGASGKTVIHHYARTVLPGYAFTGVKASGDKVTRAKPFSAAVQNNLVKFVRGPWLRKLFDRLTPFPSAGAHDDMVDAASGAHRALAMDPEPWTAEKVARAFNGEAVSLDGPKAREI